MSDEARRRLDEAGRRPVPAPDPAFADALEVRLRAVAAGLSPASPPPPPRRVAAGWWVAAAGAALAVVALVAVLGPGSRGPDQTPGPAPALAGPVNVEVALTDGTVLEDPDGLRLPEGAVISVGEEGSARIGDTVLGPGDVATIRDGRLEVTHPSPAGVLPDPTPTRAPRPEATPRPATAAPSDRPAVATPSPTATPPPTPRPTRSPAPTPEPTPRPTLAEPPPTAQPTPTSTPAIVRPRLRARLIDGPRIAVRWTGTWGAASYVLVATASRSGPAPDPVYPGSRVIGEFASPPDGALRLRVRDGVVEMRLMVVALRENDRVLRRSRIVTIAIPPPGDTLGSDPIASATPVVTFPLTPTPSPTPSSVP